MSKPAPLVWVLVKGTGMVGWVDPAPLPGDMIRVVFRWDDGAYWADELEVIWRT